MPEKRDFLHWWAPAGHDMIARADDTGTMPALFRIAGLLVTLITGAINLADVIDGGPAGLARWAPKLTPANQTIAFSSLLVLAVGILFAFCLVFWRVTGKYPTETTNRTVAAALTTQLLIGALFPDLMVIVACEAGYLLSGRWRSRWIYAQVTFWVLFVLVSQAGDRLTAAPELAAISRVPALFLTVAQVLAWQVFAFAAGHLAGRELDLRRSLSLANAELRATQQVLSDSARISERLNIARELHDTIGHHLAALSLKLQMASKLAEGSAKKPIDEAYLVAKVLLSDVRAAVSSVREEGGVDLTGALRTLCSTIDSPRIEVQASEAATIKDPLQAQVLLRCVQEAVTNAMRHAQATLIVVRLRKEDSGLQLEISDNGHGSAEIRPGNGLRGMRERLELAGGELEIETQKGNGFRLLARLPLKEEAL